jgi:hypothetical protein
MSEKSALSEERRREIFAALVEAQDSGVAVAQSRRDIAKRFGIDAVDVSSIEKEGMEQEWPPL